MNNHISDKHHALLAMLLCCSVMTTMAQVRFNGKYPASDSRTQSLLITVPQQSLGSSCNFTVQLDDSIGWATIDDTPITSQVQFPVVSGDTTYCLRYAHGDTVEQRTIRFTGLPTLQLWGTFRHVYAPGLILLDEPDNDHIDTLLIKAKWAGSSTNHGWYHKHHYHIKLIDSNGDKVDRSLLGLREDNHWRLESGLIDMGRIRNHTAHALWADFDAKPYYADKQPNARTYARGRHVELFFNGEYWGFYNLCENIDRKQLKLKKYDDSQGIFHGMLWKGKHETDATTFTADSPSDSTQNTWDGFLLKYPDIDDVCPTDYSVLHQAVNFVATSSDDEFNAHVAEYLDLPALASYYVFINVLLAIDNSCKNLMWACYDQAIDPRLTIVVWDLDATVGQHWSDIDNYYRAPTIGPENELTQVSSLGNSRLFTRLMTMPTFRNRVINTYWTLRPTLLDPDSLIARYTSTLDTLKLCGALQRETQRWSGDSDIANRDLDFDDECSYITDWLQRRIAYLDTHTFARITGDVNTDGEVSIADVNAIIDFILSSTYDLQADVNNDGEVTIADVNAVIDIILNASEQ